MNDEGQRWSLPMDSLLDDGGRPAEIRLKDGENDRCYRYPYIWLKNNCRCSSCASGDSGFRNQVIRDFHFRSAPVDIKVSPRASYAQFRSLIIS